MFVLAIRFLSSKSKQAQSPERRVSSAGRDGGKVRGKDTKMEEGKVSETCPPSLPDPPAPLRIKRRQSRAWSLERERCDRRCTCIFWCREWNEWILMGGWGENAAVAPTKFPEFGRPRFVFKPLVTKARNIEKVCRLTHTHTHAACDCEPFLHEKSSSPSLCARQRLRLQEDRMRAARAETKKRKRPQIHR